MKRRELKLTSDERAWLEHFTGAGSANHQAFKRAQVLLAADKLPGDWETVKPYRDAENVIEQLGGQGYTVMLAVARAVREERNLLKTHDNLR